MGIWHDQEAGLAPQRGPVAAEHGNPLGGRAPRTAGAHNLGSPVQLIQRQLSAGSSGLDHPVTQSAHLVSLPLNPDRNAWRVRSLAGSPLLLKYPNTIILHQRAEQEQQPLYLHCQLNPGHNVIHASRTDPPGRADDPDTGRYGDGTAVVTPEAASMRP